jgi:hypothetical protein
VFFIKRVDQKYFEAPFLRYSCEFWPWLKNNSGGGGGRDLMALFWFPFLVWDLFHLQAATRKD